MSYQADAIDMGADPPDVPEQVTVSATEFARLRYVAELIIEYEPGTQGPTLEYIKERAKEAA